jgi:tRNA dimethylallyltransferase
MKGKINRFSKNLIALGGPTAVGKTEMAIQLANYFHSPIISADSRQLYHELSIGTAKPTKAELNTISHHFIDHINITDKYNVSIFEKECIELLNDIFLNKDVVVMTGGTGFYMNAVMDGLDDIPSTDPSIRDELTEEWESGGLEKLQIELKKADPEYANQVDMQNPRRIIRALSVIRATGKPYSYFTTGEKTKRDFQSIRIMLSMPREELYKKINDRVDRMINDGLVDEVKSLIRYKDLQALQTVGYRELISFLEDEISFERAVDLIKQNSRRYAKRQLTWFRNQGNWTEFHPQDLDGIIQFIESAD